MKVVVNGDPCELPSALTVAELLARLEQAPRGVAVEINRQLVPRAAHADRQIAEGDELEIVTLVGGG